MSSARGAAGANKPKLHNVNNVYSGKNNAASRATGPNRYGGLQSIGKASVVRRMPPPASLPSLKSECNGSSVSIIPAGSTGWNKATTTSDTSTDIKAAPVEANGSTSTSSTKVASITGSTDMRPDWAKSASQAEMTAEPQVQATSKTQSTDISAPASATAADESSDESSAPINLKMSSSSSGTGYIAATVRAPTVNRSLPSRYCGGYDEKASEKYRIAKRGMFKEDMIEGHSQEPPAQNKENDVASQREKEHKEVSETPEKQPAENSGPVAVATSVNVVAPMQPPPSSTPPATPSNIVAPSAEQIPPAQSNAWNTGSAASSSAPPPPAQQHQQYVPAQAYPHQPQQVIAKAYGDERQQQAMFYPPQGGESYRPTHPGEQQQPPQQPPHGNRMYDSRGSTEMFQEYDRNYRKDQQQPPNEWNRPQSARYGNDQDGMGWYEQPVYRNTYGSGWQQPAPPARFPPQGSQQNGTAAWYTTAVPGPQIVQVPQPEQQPQHVMKGQMRGAYPPQGPPHVLQRRTSQTDLDQTHDYIIDEPSRGQNQGQERDAAIERSRQKRRIGNDFRQQQSSLEVDNSYGGQWNGPPKDNRHQERPSGKSKGANRRSEGSDYVAEGFKVLQRPAQEAPLVPCPVPSINDEEEAEIQLKKLPKSGRITKRDPRPKPSEKKAEKASSDSKTSESSSKDASNDSAQGRDSSPVKPAPVPVDNVWERRLEERVSAEREKEQQLKQQQTQQPQQNKGHRKEQRQHAPTESKTDVPYFDEDRATKRGGGVSRRGNPSGTGFSRGGSRAPLNGQKARTEPQPDFGDNFSNMGEFHVEDTMIESKPKRSGKTRGNNGMIHRGNGRKVLLPDPVDVKRTQVEGQEPQPMARIPKEKEQRGRRVIGTRGKLRGGMSSATVRKPTRNVSRQSQLTVHTEPSVVEEAIPTSSLPPTAYGERGAMLKSPVNSSEGCGEEWETASESSGVISKLTTKEATVQPAEAKQPIQPVTKSASSSSVPSQKKSSTTKAENSTSNTTNNSQRQIGPKNAKPASHTSLVRGASSSKNSNGAIKNSSQAKSERVGRSSSASNARDSGNKVSVSTGLNNKDGLAGVDINNASVIVIDDHPATLDVASTTDEGFVEVLSKAAKRQRQLEEQAKAEAEKKKALKEKERQEKLQAKREKAAVRAPGKKAEKQQHRKDKGAKGPVSDSEADASTNNRIVKKEGLIKTVWNSDIVPPTPEESLRGALPVIPSPIARPTPKPISKTAEADVSLTVVAKTPEPVVPKEEATVSPVGDVKEFWPGQQAEFPSTLQTAPNPVPPPVSAAQGPNVAKVRPQPQSTTDVVAPVVQKEPVVQQQANMNNPKRMAAPSPVQAVPQAQGQNAGPMFPNQNAHYQPLMQAPSPFGGITMPPYSVMFNGDVMHPATTNSPPAQSLFAPIPFNAHPNQRPVPQSVPPPSRGSAASSNFEVGPFFPAPNIGPTWSTSELTTPPPAAPQRFFNSAAAYSVPPPNKGCPPPVAQAQRPNFNQPPPPHMHPFGMQTGLEFANKQQAQRMQGPPQPLHNFGNNFPAPHPPQPPNYRYGPHPTAMFGNDAVWSANPKDTLPAQPQSYGLFQKPPPNVPTSGYAPMMPGRNDRWNYSQRGAYSQPQQQQHQYHHAKENVFSEQQNGRTSVASTSSGANNKAAGKA